MAKASPAQRTFAGGQWSPLVAGRTDLDRFPSAVELMHNTVAAPQGPALSRSGTEHINDARRHDQKSVIAPFIFSNDQALCLEFAQDRIRFFNQNGGILTYASEAVTFTSSSGGSVTFTSATLAAEVGDQVIFSGFDNDLNVNFDIVTITAKVGNDYTTDGTHPTTPDVLTGIVSRIYHVDCTYTEAQLDELRFVQSIDVVYILSTRRTRKLERYGTYDWRLSDVQFVDGPFLDTNITATSLTPTSTGNAVPNMTGNTSPSGTASASSNRPSVNGTGQTPVEFLGRNLYYELAASSAYFGFNEDDDSYWAGAVEQVGWLSYQPATPFVCDGYAIHLARDNKDSTYISLDYAPSTFTFEGYDGSSWVVIDEQQSYVLYENNRSVFINVANTVAYERYRLNVTQLYRNGSIECRIRRLVLRDAAETTITLNASSVVGINRDQGFLSTDVGRLIRLKGSDTAWRSVEITAVNSTTQVDCKILGEPLPNTRPILDWRLGYWSDTTGWPRTGDFDEDRLWLAGAAEYPDTIGGSQTGNYENFSQTDTFGEVLDDNAVVVTLNARRLSRVRWISSDSRAILVGTGSEEYSLAAPNNDPITARNIKARPATRRGSADVEPVRIDDQLLYVQRGNRTVREFAFVFEADNYKSPSMSQLASDLGAKKFVEMEHAAEPYSIVWVLREDNSLAGLTYNRDENVVGWHVHDFDGAEVESIAVLPSEDGLQDILWLACKRTVNGQTKRYIERLRPFWDFGDTVSDAWYVDSGLRYEGVPVTKLYGLKHLEGEQVYGLADGKPLDGLTVVNGSVELPYAASNVLIGRGFESETRLLVQDAGAQDGTSQGKEKRVTGVVLQVWDSGPGQVGRYVEHEDDYVYENVEYNDRQSLLGPDDLITGNTVRVPLEPGYDHYAKLAFKRRKEDTLPFNVVAMYPQLVTQDR